MAREYFAVYAETCFAKFGDRVKHWITINEPLQTAVNGYGIGIFAPGRYENSSFEPYLAAHHQLLAHAAAVAVYKKKFKACSLIYFILCILVWLVSYVALQSLWRTYFYLLVIKLFIFSRI